MSIRLKRAYDDAEKSDGYRVLIDRLWPRGVSKKSLQLDGWSKEMAPSNELRQWFDHEPNKFESFKEKYHSELDQKPKLVEDLLEIARNNDKITLVYATKNSEHNNAVVLKEYLENRL